MSDNAWAGLVATAYDDSMILTLHSKHASFPEDFEVYWRQLQSNPYLMHGRYRKGFEPDRVEPTREEAEDAFKATIWKQAVLHAEMKARAGLEPHWLLFHIHGFNHSSLRGHSYQGYVPTMTYCQCCHERPVLIEDPANWPIISHCQTCLEAGHNEEIGAAHRWHDFFGIWWVEQIVDNGPDYFPSSDVVWYQEEGGDEAQTRVAAAALVPKLGELDCLNIYTPEGERIEFYRPT